MAFVDLSRARYRKCQALKQRYGLTLREYSLMWSAQKGRCAICLADDPMRPKRPLGVEHCHRTGEVRGLACHACNFQIARAEKGHRLSIAWERERITEYLKNPPARAALGREAA